MAGSHQVNEPLVHPLNGGFSICKTSTQVTREKGNPSLCFEIICSVQTAHGICDAGGMHVYIYMYIYIYMHTSICMARISLNQRKLDKKASSHCTRAGSQRLNDALGAKSYGQGLKTWPCGAPTT